MGCSSNPNRSDIPENAVAKTRKELDDELGSLLVDDVLEYLDDLRDSGITNMYGAPAYVEKEFKMAGMTKQQSIDLTGMWMDTFTERHPG
jgi:hypothetical protein